MQELEYKEKTEEYKNFHPENSEGVKVIIREDQLNEMVEVDFGGRKLDISVQGARDLALALRKAPNSNVKEKKSRKYKV